MATEYLLVPPTYRGADPEAITSGVLDRLQNHSYAELLAEHVADCQRLYKRTSLQLGGGVPKWEALPTNERWALYAKGDYADVGLKEMAFHFGKYLLISAVWLCRHVWEQYEFTRDSSYLQETAYPLMKEAAESYLNNLVEYQGRLVLVPAVSAEHESRQGFLEPSFHHRPRCPGRLSGGSRVGSTQISQRYHYSTQRQCRTTRTRSHSTR